MVWGGIMRIRKTNLIVVQGYINQILQPEAAPFFKGMGLQYWCMIMQGLMLQGYVDSF